ncbi:PREDICTED: beclin 1-associated autophagy-related key regulator-like [Acropora digitifera]|uniref:beclin 1-associated autophagy-related key regulator-like n=1 Tax=Acropora digitifera TaxID=70779 RepID=UPI00077AC22C|nr:PREDICTED: beclin 1-associated autophagy-related key regulator-like [Acropora digitifera]
MASHFQGGNGLTSCMITSPLLICPLCNNKRRSFTCQLCIDNGNFSHFSPKYSERYCEKLRKLENLKRLKKEYQNRVLDVLKATEGAEKLNFEVISSRQQVLLLRLVVKEATQDLSSEVDALDVLEKTNDSLQTKQTERNHKIQLKTKQLQQYQAVASKSKKELEAMMDKLCLLRRSSISQIQKYIFPLQVDPVHQVLGTPPLKDYDDICCDIQSDNDDESCQSQLAEATRTSYIEGRWVSEEENVRMACSINGACLPANGDYSAYHDWGLYVFTSFSFYLYLFIYYTIFVFQHVEPSLLHPRRTLHNLYTCVNSLQLGRGGSFQCHPELISIRDESNDSDHSDLSSEEACSESDAEWENLPANLVHTTELITVQSSMSQSSSSGDSEKKDEPATAASLVSSAAASVAALWPWKK